MNDTIAAIASAAGSAGIGVIRVSGPLCAELATQLLGRTPKPRYAHRVLLRDAAGEALDDGLLLFFPGPHSYTGEDVLELQGHGSPVVLALLLRSLYARGVRAARAGEFSERAFLNGKLDLAQAEAVADLISSQSETAARAALRSLQGEFSQRVQVVLQRLIELRMWIEAAIDFPEEEIDFLADSGLRTRALALIEELRVLLQQTRKGQRLRDGLYVVIVGPPNAGKSSLLNRLAGSDSAIVTEIAGTTRDVLREQIQIEGLAVTLVDTAGIRETRDVIEAEGIRRARLEIERADLALLLVEWDTSPAQLLALRADLPSQLSCLVVRNKLDLAPAQWTPETGELALSTRSGAGLEQLQAALLQAAGLSQGSEGSWSARSRHVQALEQVAECLDQAWSQLQAGQGELAAADLYQAQEHLGSITGQFSSDALLGEIFSRFCIGK